MNLKGLCMWAHAVAYDSQVTGKIVEDGSCSFLMKVLNLIDSYYFFLATSRSRAGKGVKVILGHFRNGMLANSAV
jgi:hypothetical protein